MKKYFLKGSWFISDQPDHPEYFRINSCQTQPGDSFTETPQWFLVGWGALRKTHQAALKWFRSQKSEVSFVDGGVLTEWIISSNTPASVWASQTFPSPISLSSPCVSQLSWLSQQSASITPFFPLVSRILTNCALFDDRLIIPFHFCHISNSTTASSLCSTATCASVVPVSSLIFYWLSRDLLGRVRLFVVFLAAEHVAL